MTHGPTDHPAAVPTDLLAELAADGGLCETCGGLHIPSIDVAILSFSLRHRSNVALPWCHCEPCQVCQHFREAVAELVAKSPSLQRLIANDRS